MATRSTTESTRTEHFDVLIVTFSKSAAAPWRTGTNYLTETVSLRHRKIDDHALRFSAHPLQAGAPLGS